MMEGPPSPSRGGGGGGDGVGVSARSLATGEVAQAAEHQHHAVHVSIPVVPTGTEMEEIVGNNNRRASSRRAEGMKRYREEFSHGGGMTAGVSYRGSIVAIEEIHSAQSLHSAKKCIPFYSVPVQRQLWDEDQVLPHVNWGDLFFDLFFVAAAYNVGVLLTGVLTPSLAFRGTIYFVGIFGPIYMIWSNKLLYDSRYTIIDYFHRLVDVIRVLCLSLAVLHIKTFDVMTDPTKNAMFGFCLGLLLESFIQIVLRLEVLFVGEGDKVALRRQCKRLLYEISIPVTGFYLAATVLSGLALFNHDDGTTGYANKAEGYLDYDGGSLKGNASSSSHLNETTADQHEGGAAGDGHLRFLAGGGGGDYTSSSSSSSWSMDDLPIAICLMGYLYNNVAMFIRIAILPGGGEHKKWTIPMNIDFCIHRYGEFVMLMLGESVLSLLIVEVAETVDYYITVFLGLVTVIALQTLHFESQPSSADHHAMRRDKLAGMTHGILLQIYSMALVAFGVSFKVMLTMEYSSSASSYASSSYGEEDGGADYGHHRRTSFALVDSMNPFSIDGKTERVAGSSLGHHHRSLAGSIHATPRSVAALFSGALTIALLSLEVSTLAHRGLRTNTERCYNHTGDASHRRLGLKVKCLAVILLKVGLLGLCATLSLWIDESEYVAVAGFLIVVMFILTRVLGWTLFEKPEICKAVAAARHEVAINGGSAAGGAHT